jgi:organic hydroperoxide reductase OsmC/OhrA
MPADTMKAKAERLLRMAEHNCLITNSLSADIHLDIEIEKVPDRQPI